MPEPNGSDTFHMVQLRLNARRLAGLGQRLGLFRRNRRVSTNYLVHCALGELFQDQAPKPFCVQDAPRRIGKKAGRGVRVLGYTSVSDEVLHELAKGFAPPAVYKGCYWDELATKPMPQRFSEGMRLRFELRACPVIRKGSAGEGANRQGEKRSWREGQELDAFLAEAWTRPDEDDLSREIVYRNWLVRQLDERGGATVDPENVSMDRFSIERMTRRNGSDRTPDTIKRPDATLTGTMTVTDGQAFSDLLRSGIGRHKSFGFGMLKVRRV